jgi:predicted GNAT family acetyltransferase
MNADHDVAIVDNPEKKRFETTVEGHTAFIDYLRHGDTIWYTHTKVPAELEGRGIGSALAKHVLDYAVTNSLKVVPACAFIEDYIGSHSEYASLVKRERAPRER